MPIRYLLDTNVCIHIRRRHPGIYARYGSLAPDQMAISAITFGELVYGVRKSQNPQRARDLLDRMVEAIPVLPIGPAVAEAYGRIRADLAARGSLIGANDLWIAAHALADGLVLVSGNVREFERVDGLTVENWLEQP